MSSIVRSQLELFISSERVTIRNSLRDARAEAIEKRDYDLSASLEEIENMLMGFMPIKSAFPTPDEYINALRSYAFTLSLLSSLFRHAGISTETLSMAKKLMSITLEKVEMGKLIENAKKILSEKEYGREVFIDGCKTYVGLLVGRVKEFDRQELHIVKEALTEIFAGGKPIRRLSDLAKELGAREKDLMRILKRMPDIDPNIIVKEKYVAMKNKLKEYIEDLLSDKGYILISDQAKELSLEPKYVVDALKILRDIFPNLRVYEDKIVYIPNILANYVEDIVRESIVISYEELAAKLGIYPKPAAEILKETSRYFSETAIIEKVLINKKRIVSWLSKIFGERPVIFVDEVAGIIGVGSKTAKAIADLAAALSKGDIVTRQNRVIYKPNMIRILSEAIREQVLPEDIASLKETDPRLVEDAVYKQIHQKLLDFEKTVMRGR